MTGLLLVTVAWLVQLSTTRLPLIQSRTPSFEVVWNVKLPVAAASNLPVQRTEKLSLLTPGPGELVLQPKLTASVRSRTGAPARVLLLKYCPASPVPGFGDDDGGCGGGTSGAAGSWLPICCRYATRAGTSDSVTVMPLCARMASASVGAEPRCKYGAVDQTSRNVGMSMADSTPFSRFPLAAAIVPIFCGLLLPLLVNAVPPWQLPQFLASNTARPACPEVVRLPSASRNGLAAKAFREPTYAANASRSALTPAFLSPKGWLREPVFNCVFVIKPVPPARLRIWPSKSCTSSKLLLQWRKPWPPPRPRRLMVLRSPSPKPVRSHTRPSWPPSL